MACRYRFGGTMIDLKEYLELIEPVDDAFGKETQQREDFLTKPQGSLGRLEEIAVSLASMKREPMPEVKRKAIFTFAGDHGVVDEGVSAFPREVTPQMVYNLQPTAQPSMSWPGKQRLMSLSATLVWHRTWKLIIRISGTAKSSMEPTTLPKVRQ